MSVAPVVVQVASGEAGAATPSEEGFTNRSKRSVLPKLHFKTSSAVCPLTTGTLERTQSKPLFVALRTCIDVVDGQPVQVILPPAPVELPGEDLRALPAPEREAALHERLQALAAEPFDLAEAPLFRARLFRLGEEEYAFYFCAHHIVWDGWSFDILYREMAALYAAHLDGRDSPLPPLATHHGDFTAWHREWMADEQTAAELAHCLFLDTETTGLSGGAGTTVFMVGLGFVDGEELVLEQVFLRSFAEERAALRQVAQRLQEHPLQVTFVGKSFDRHRLAARMTLHRLEHAMLDPRHLDLFHVARRAWKHELPDTRLRTVEEHKLGFVRHDDLPGSEAPRAWLDWLRDGSGRVDRVMEHNRLDVLSLVALMGCLGTR